MERRRWSELSECQKIGVAIGATIQLTLAATAWTDLAFRPAYQVRGSKPMWAAVIAVSYVGPISYFVRGVQHHAPAIP